MNVIIIECGSRLRRIGATQPPTVGFGDEPKDAYPSPAEWRLHAELPRTNMTKLRTKLDGPDDEAFLPF